MKRLRKVLAAGMSLLLILPALLVPLQAAAEEQPQLVTSFIYKDEARQEEAGVQTAQNAGPHVNCPLLYNDQSVDLTKYDADSLYLQMDVLLDKKDSTINMVFMQPHSASNINPDHTGDGLRNCRATAAEIEAAAQAGGWYTLSVPLTSIANDDGIDLTDIVSMCFYINTEGLIDVQAKNFRIVHMTAEDIRAALDAEVKAPLPEGEDGYVSLTAYNAAIASATALLENAQTAPADLLTAWNVLITVKDQLVPIPTGVNKDALKTAMEEPTPDGPYSRDAVKAYEAAKAAGQIVYDNLMATQDEVDAALKAITAAKAALYDITYLVAEFPAVDGSDGDGVFTWSISGATNFGVSTLAEPVDLSAHDPAKLRFRVDMRLTAGDASSISQLTLQPKDIDNNMQNKWDTSPKDVLGDGEWHTFERDFSLNFIYENWYKVDKATMHLQTNAPVTLEVRNFRIVDITLDDEKAKLSELMKTAVGDASIYPEAVWLAYQDALGAAQGAVDEATTNEAVWQAYDALQAAIDALGSRGILMEAINETLPEGKTYSAASLAAYEAAKEAGRAILKDETASNEQLDEALQAIKDARAALVETTFLAAQFPMADQSETDYQGHGVYTVADGVYRYEGKAVNIDSAKGFSPIPVDLAQHDRTKLYMQFDILFEEGSAASFTRFFIRPTLANGSVPANGNHDATEAVNAVSGKQGVWHTISTPLSTAVALSDIAGMSFYMLGADLEAIYKLQVKNFRLVDLSDEPVLSTLFADGMMFQQNKPITVFGQGGAGKTVTVSLYKDSAEAPVATQMVTVGADGRWSVDLLKDTGIKGGYDTYTLTVQGAAITHTYRNILIGEVWVAGGQSNMEYNIQNDVNNTKILEQTDEFIRIFYEPSLVYGNEADQPLTPDFSVKNAVWADGTNIDRLKSASSVAYNFALELRKKLDVPVGFLNTSLGGTYIEAWISREGIESDAEVKTYLQEHNRYYDVSNWPQTFNRMSALYNQKIGALRGYRVAGTIWYQGETNLQSGDIGVYTNMLGLLQKDWSRVFGFEDTEMPLIFAHIAPHTYNPVQGSSQATVMAYFWEAMADAWANSPQTMAQVPLYDLPLTHYYTSLTDEVKSNGPIHPADKTPVGQRMAAAAMNLVYGGTEAASAPVYKSMTAADGKIRLTFDQVGSGLSIKDNAATLHGFAIAGADGVYVDAQAKIVSKDTVEVWNDRVKDPKQVTYAFSSFNMAANLQNATGIAAAPFRTSRSTVDSQLYLPKDWQYADGETWVATGHSDTTKMESLWQSEKAALSYDTAVKAEGTASLKAVYSAGAIGIGPVYGKNSVINQMDGFSYLTVHVKNPDDRIKIMKLQFTFGASVYTAALADQEGTAGWATQATLEANSDFTAYAFCIRQLINPRGELVTNEATVRNILKNASKMEWVVTDRADGRLYFDDVRFGMEALAVDPPQPSVDKTALQATVDDAKTVDTGYFTADTVKPFEETLARAEAILARDDATQEEVNNVSTALTQAKNALKPAYFAGDINGDGEVTATDALMALQAATSKIALSDKETAAANVDQKNSVTAADALLILQFATEKISSF